IVDAIVIVSEPTVVQDAPSVERNAVMVLPARVSFTHIGAAPARPDVLTDAPLVDVRRWNARPLAALTSIIALRDPAASDSRIITPALVQSAVCWTDATRVTMEPSPDSVV